MLVSKKITCFTTNDFRGCSHPLFRWYTGSEKYFTHVSIRQSHNLVRDKIKAPGSAFCFSVALVSLSVITMPLNYSFSKLKNDFSTLPISGFLGLLSVSVSKSPVFLVIFSFL